MLICKNCQNKSCHDSFIESTSSLMCSYMCLSEYFYRIFKQRHLFILIENFNLVKSFLPFFFLYHSPHFSTDAQEGYNPSLFSLHRQVHIIPAGKFLDISLIWKYTIWNYSYFSCHITTKWQLLYVFSKHSFTKMTHYLIGYCPHGQNNLWLILSI